MSLQRSETSASSSLGRRPLSVGIPNSVDIQPIRPRSARYTRLTSLSKDIGVLFDVGSHVRLHNLTDRFISLSEGYASLPVSLSAPTVHE